MLAPVWEFVADISLLGFQHLQRNLSPELALFQGAGRPAICMWFANSVRISFYCKIVLAASRSYTKS
jgi:hypothetical protein